MNRNKLYVFLLSTCALGLIWLFLTSLVPGRDLIVCPFRNLYGIPCPSCGSTRGVLSLVRGEWREAFLWNPNSYLLAFLMLVIPVWIVADFVRGSHSLYRLFSQSEGPGRPKSLWIVIFTLILINWIWTLLKGG